MRKGFALEISADCTVNLSYHQDLTSLLVPQQGAKPNCSSVLAQHENWFMRSMRILWFQTVTSRSPKMLEGKATEDKAGELRTWVITARVRFWKETQDNLCIVSQGCTTASFKRWQSKSRTFNEPNDSGSFRSLRCFEFSERTVKWSSSDHSHIEEPYKQQHFYANKAKTEVQHSCLKCYKMRCTLLKRGRNITNDNGTTTWTNPKPKNKLEIRKERDKQKDISKPIVLLLSTNLPFPEE